MTTSSTAATAAANHHYKFSQTCNLLSQYLKVNGSVSDLNLVLTSPKPHGLTTKNLLPTVEESGQSNNGQTLDLNQPPSEGRAQMTIFYNGQVIVLNEFSQDKAHKIMDLASKVSGANQNKSVAATSTTTTMTCGGVIRKPSAKAGLMELTNGLMSSQPLCEGDMPIMRNASLARFIAKRKDRIRARAPYQIKINEASSSNVDNTKQWLGL